MSSRTGSRQLLKHSTLALLGAALMASQAQAASFVVTNTGDTDGVCNAASCSLREAIKAANATASPPHSITFNIPGTGPFIISPATALPTINLDIDISAASQAINGAPGVRIDGSAQASGNGLTFSSTANGSSVAYLSITNFPGYGINIASASTTVTNCHIGALPDGTTAGGNGLSGIRLQAAQAVIGGTAATGNLVSGNQQHGIVVESGAAFSTIRGNRIGTNLAGTAAIPNGADGINGNGAEGTKVGGNLAGEGNLISGNTNEGIDLGASSSFWSIQGTSSG